MFTYLVTTRVNRTISGNQSVRLESESHTVFATGEAHAKAIGDLLCMALGEASPSKTFKQEALRRLG